ncbi:hypothetical protein [Rhodovulum sp. 12E13]|uniref:hypothetical protein n=1 Tax=Rhodovulum sp. 12E13 TaxID=2203891 RepID=UPI0011C065A1|nr:hypothetical protein [Rhodovulum sp. 12E13]
MPFARLFAVLAAVLAAPAALAGGITLQVSVLDPETFEQRPPRGDTRWVIEGPGDFSFAEQHGAMEAMTYDLAPGTYRITVWELETRAAAEHRATVEGEATQTAYLLLSPAQSGLVDAVMDRMNRPEPPAAPAETPAAAPVPADPAAAMPQETPAAAPAVAAPMGLALGPGAVLVVSLPDLPDPENDFVGLADGGAGWLSTVERGGRDEAALTLPEAPGAYTLEYVAVPEMEVLSILEVTVR